MHVHAFLRRPHVQHTSSDASLMLLRVATAGHPVSVGGRRSVACAAHGLPSAHARAAEFHARLLTLGATEAQATAFKRLYRSNPSTVFGAAPFADERDAHMVRIYAAGGGVLSVEDASFLAWNAFLLDGTERLPHALPMSTQRLVHTLLRLRDVAHAHGLSLCDLGHHGDVVELLATPGEEDGPVYRLHDALETLSFLPPPVLRAVARSMRVLDVTSMHVDDMRIRWSESSLSKLSPAELVRETQHPRFQSYVTNILC